MQKNHDEAHLSSNSLYDTGVKRSYVSCSHEKVSFRDI